VKIASYKDNFRRKLVDLHFGKDALRLKEQTDSRSRTLSMSSSATPTTIIVAIIWEADEPSASRCITYRELKWKAARFRNVRKNFGVRNDISPIASPEYVLPV
jgi:hypothetical protein